MGLATLFGTLLCIVFTVIFVKRKRRRMDEETASPLEPAQARSDVHASSESINNRSYRRMHSLSFELTSLERTVENPVGHLTRVIERRTSDVNSDNSFLAALPVGDTLPPVE